MPQLSEYFSYCFFVPTLAVGPISPYSAHARSLKKIGTIDFPQAIYRVSVGAAKYYFLSSLLNQIGYQSLLFDGHRHAPIDLLVAAIAYYFYIYCNFSGFCDIAIGTAGLIGIEVHENFDEPLSARNIREFWNRWHMTLSSYLRDVVFSPLSKKLVTIGGRNSVDHSSAIAIFVVFILIGFWHGTSLNYLLFGALHASAMVIHHYYSLILKKHLGREKYRVYTQSRVIRNIGVGITFCFVTVSFFLFANSISEMQSVFEVIQ